MLRYCFTLFLSLLFCNSTPAREEHEKGFAGDFRILVESLRELDPMLYKVMGRELLDAKVKEVDARLQQTTSKHAAIYLIQEFLYQLGDSHTSVVSAYGDLGVNRILPFKVFILKDELYIRNYSADTSFNGAKIFAIDRTDARSIIDSLKIFYPSDGQRSGTGFGLPALFNSLYAAFCHERDTFFISTSKGKLRAAAVKKGDPSFHSLVRYSWMEYTGLDHFFQKEITKDYGYFRFSEFEKNADGHHVEKEFRDFIMYLRENKVPNAIIDLRYNAGGDPYMAGRMASFFCDRPFNVFENIILTPVKRPTHLALMADRFSYRFRLAGTKRVDDHLEKVKFEKGLQKYYPAKEGFKGKVYVITGSMTSSAATMFCSYLMNQKNAVFVGSETEGAINYFCAHQHCDLRLPALSIRVTFSTELIELKKGSSENEKPRGLVPGNYIEYTIQDLLEHKDKELDWIKNDIANFFKK